MQVTSTRRLRHVRQLIYIIIIGLNTDKVPEMEMAPGFRHGAISYREQTDDQNFALMPRVNRRPIVS